MHLTQDTYVHAMFFMECDDFNWMATIFRRGEGPWQGEYRFRYFMDNKAHDSEDERSWYEGQAPDSSDESLQGLMEAMRTAGGGMAEHLEVPFEEIPVGGGPERTVEVLSQQPWANVKTVNSQPGA
tara:strand:- start:1060 stop:1437 length:378 start_codon:yes stop_codon:yes gene_type:complete